MRKKSKGLLTPYVVTQIFVYVGLVLLGFVGIKPFDLSWSDYFYRLVHPAASFLDTYWFMPTILVVMIIARAALYVVRREWILVPLMGVSLLFFVAHPEWAGMSKTHTPLNYTGVAVYFVWWGAGYLFCKYQARIHRALRLESGWVCLGLMASLVVSHSVWPQALWLSAMVGVLFAISLSFNYIKRGFKFLNHLYGHSFTIYLLHCFVFFAARIFVDAMPMWLYMPIAAVCGVYIPWLIAKFVQQRLPNGRLLKLLVGVR